MVKPSSVNFINKSDQAVRIRSVDKRFDVFNLAPGQEVRKTDSITCSGNYAINADILINPAGRNNSEFIGNFKFDNPSPFYAQSYALASGFVYRVPVTSEQQFYDFESSYSGSINWGRITPADAQLLKKDRTEPPYI
jgi:hypothetical protein